MAQLRDVAIVGAGVLGLAAGRAVAARGRDAVILEQAEIGHPGSGSKGSCRIFRVGYREPGYVTAALQARDLWRTLETASGRQILYPRPQLTFGTGMRSIQEAMIAAGAPCELIPAAEAARRFPAIAADGPALLEPDSAVIAADQALAALVAGDAEIRTGIRVTRMSDDGRQVTLQTTAGDFRARIVIVTAGPWSGGLLATAGVPLPGRPVLEQVAYLRSPQADRDAGAGDTASLPDNASAADTASLPDAASAPIFICHADQVPYGLPVPGSPLYKIGIHQSGPATDPDAQDDSADFGLIRALAHVARRYLPGYDPEPVATERCIYDNSPDEDFIVDRIGNVVIGCGTSGHGFKFGPLLGEWLADLATGSPDFACGASARQTQLDSQLAQRFTIGRFRQPH
jgi:sarcosine oxidase